jgi:hypothetical protein
MHAQPTYITYARPTNIYNICTPNQQQDQKNNEKNTDGNEDNRGENKQDVTNKSSSPKGATKQPGAAEQSSSSQSALVQPLSCIPSFEFVNPVASDLAFVMIPLTRQTPQLPTFLSPTSPLQDVSRGRESLHTSVSATGPTPSLMTKPRANEPLPSSPPTPPPRKSLVKTAGPRELGGEGKRENEIHYAMQTIFPSHPR